MYEQLKPHIEFALRMTHALFEDLAAISSKTVSLESIKKAAETFIW